MIDEFDELVELLAREQGRPPAELAAVELLPAIGALRSMADAAPRTLRGRRIGAQRALFPIKRARVEYEAAGVVGVIGAGSAPFAQPLGQVAAGLVAGNGVVLKPSARAALSGERIARALARAGLPEGLLRVVHGEAEVGRALVESELGALFFTGRAETAQEVRLECARRGRPVAADTGGGDSMLVLGDANVARAAGGAAWAGFAASGQARGSLERIDSGCGSAGGKPGSNVPSTSRPQTFSKRTWPTRSSMSTPR